MCAWLCRNRLSAGLVIAFFLFQLAPLYFNIDEPEIIGKQNQCDRYNETQRNPNLPDDPKFIPRPNDDLKIIRLTNSGEFADRCELTNALDELNWDRNLPNGPAVKAGAERLPRLALLYIHGWKHNADKDDTDLVDFRKLVEALREKEPRRYVVGIYVGWNADAPLWGWFENITFWVKKNNADRIAQSSSVTEIYSAIGSVVRKDPAQLDQFIAIGHSFGARLLFSATAQPLVAAAEEAHPGYIRGTYKVIRGLADAIVLLNPAFEATRYSAINGFIRSRENFDKVQAPLIVTISSEADLATEWAFPIGQWLGLAHTDRERHTLGNYIPFSTHSLEEQACPLNSNDSLTEAFGVDGLCMRRCPRRSKESPAPAIGAKDLCALRGDNFVQEHNPFIVARASGAIITGHNDIWNPRFRNWLAELIAELQKLHHAERQAASGNALMAPK